MSSSLPIVGVAGQAPDLRSLSPTELRALVVGWGERPFRAGQIHRWLHQRGATSFEEMSDLPKAFRSKLAEEARLGHLELDRLQRSSDGTIKFRWRTEDRKAIESVYMPEPERGRHTLCISTQVGCAMGCGFCATGTMGLSRNLSAGEIVDQVHRVNRFLIEEGLHPGPRPLTNIVYMGMGEPLHNYENVRTSLQLLLSEEGTNFSNRHVTVSTAGIVPNIERLGEETEVKLAISLNATTDEIRDRLMPVNRRWKIEDLMEACARFPIRQGRRITFEYVLFDGINDSEADLERLAWLASRARAKVNLIQYNRNEGLPYEPSPQERVEAFAAGLAARRVLAFARKNRGRDILAACGQLAAAGGPGRRPARGTLTGRLTRELS